MPFFARWAASIRHVPGARPHESILIDTFSFEARPRWLAWLLEPLMHLAFVWETRKRLDALREHFSNRSLD